MHFTLLSVRFKAKVEWDTAILACCIRGLCNISGDPVGVVTVLDSGMLLTAVHHGPHNGYTRLCLCLQK